MAHIAHIAIWTGQLEVLKDFYQTYFDATSSPKYTNPRTGFESYFLSYASGARLEIMTSPKIRAANPEPGTPRHGYSHLALSVGSEAQVIALTRRLEADGFHVFSQPRTTGDGYFESVVLDPEGNLIEITV
ncbi:MAG TPA: glyoxalase [Chloroflexi bacterium]|nr:glyoxalase [Chloroflexota bacterium]